MPQEIMNISSRGIRAWALLFLLLNLVDIQYMFAGDWPQWRGPNRDGVSTETGLLKDWPSGGPHLVWKATGLGAGYSTVSVLGDRLYTTGDAADASQVLALNVSDGKKIWNSKLGKPGAPGWGG